MSEQKEPDCSEIMQGIFEYKLELGVGSQFCCFDLSTSHWRLCHNSIPISGENTNRKIVPVVM